MKKTNLKGEGCGMSPDHPPKRCNKECYDHDSGQCKYCNEVHRDKYPHLPHWVEDDWEAVRKELPLAGHTVKKSILEAAITKIVKQQKKS
jgi:hypothetical protein